MFLVNPRSKQPLYEQLVEQLRRQLMLGVMESGAAMPSVRQLAGELGINPNTIQKAYRRMEEEGMIVTLPGRGSFVNENLAETLQKQRQEQRSKARLMIQSCRESGLTKEEILQIAEEVYKEGDVCLR